MSLIGKIKGVGIIGAALMALGALSLLNAVIYSFVTNLNIGSSIQFALSIGMVLYAFFIRRISKAIHVVVGIICLVPVLITLFLMIYGNTGSPDYDEDVIIVLGAGIRGETVTAPLALRLNAALDYFKKNPNALVVVCGGLGDRATITEAEAMERYLFSNGVPMNRIIKEDRSTNTYENLVFAKEILDDYFPGGFRAVVTTSDFHLFRASYIASRLGMPVNRTGASTPLVSLPAYCLREMLAIANVLVFPPF